MNYLPLESCRLQWCMCGPCLCYMLWAVCCKVIRRTHCVQIGSCSHSSIETGYAFGCATSTRRLSSIQIISPSSVLIHSMSPVVWRRRPSGSMIFIWILGRFVSECNADPDNTCALEYESCLKPKFQFMSQTYAIPAIAIVTMTNPGIRNRSLK